MEAVYSGKRVMCSVCGRYFSSNVKCPCQMNIKKGKSKKQEEISFLSVVKIFFRIC